VIIIKRIWEDFLLITVFQEHISEMIPLNETKMNSIRVAVLDDNPVYLFALVSLLKLYDEIDVVMASDNFKDFLDEMAEEEPDLIIIDESIVEGIRDNIWTSFLRYLKETPMIIMGLNGKVQIEEYEQIHPTIRYISKEFDTVILKNEVLKYVPIKP
jgi:DNA-binding NarL/FixJ family response regulator